MPKYPYDKSCLHCGKTFFIKSSQYKTKKFCTFECSRLHITVHDRYQTCINCDAPLSGHQRKFCSRSCSATVNNIGIRRHGFGPNNCLRCGNLTKTTSEKYCSTECSGIARTMHDAEHHRKRMAFHQSVYRSKGYRRISPDANKEKIKEIYLNCPPGYEVDHIVPLSLGGLHHENNLQYLTIEENRRKGNRWIG